MPSPTRSPAVGEQPGVKKLGRYECTEPLGGDGGFETYRGRVKGLTGLNRSFAVKVLRLKRSETASAVVEPFIQAAKRSAALANPRIATVVDTGAGEGVVFAVTPFMEGLDLSHFLAAAHQAGLLVPGKDDRAHQWFSLVAYIGAEIARGLHAAHTQNPPLFHGALCPGNVFITSKGAVRLLDFGLRAAVRRPFEPRPRRLLPYIAPELAAPAADGTMAGDMYSLGALLGELASGDPPPQGRRVNETQAQLSTLPEDLGALIGRLVSASPTARPSAEEAASILTASHADASEASMVAALSVLVQQLASSPVHAQAEAEVSLQAAQALTDDAPPPPSEVEHHEAFEVSPPIRSPEPVGPPPAEVADLSVPEPDVVEHHFVPADATFGDDSAFSIPELSAADIFTADPSVVSVAQPAPNLATESSYVPEERFGADPTTIGDQALIEDLLKQSRPTEPLGRSTAMRPAATHLASPETPAPASPPRGPTQPGFSPTGTAALESSVPVAAPESTGFSGEWAAKPAAVSDVEKAAAEAASVPALLPDSAPSEPMQITDSQVIESPPSQIVGFDAPPSTWGARALAALGGQAGIAPAGEVTGVGLLDQGLLDQVQADLSGEMPLPGSPPLEPSGEYLRSPQNLPTSELSMARRLLPTESLPPDLGVGLAESRDPAPAPSFMEEAPPRSGDALLEDQLVDAPEGMRSPSAWPEAHSTIYGMPGGPAPGASPFPEAPSAEVAQVVASVDDHSSIPVAQAYVEESVPKAKASAPAYFDDGGEPVAEPLLVAQASHAPTMLAFASAPTSAKKTAASHSTSPTSVPSWAKSPEVAKRSSRAFVWSLAGIVLGISVALGGLAGFMVGTRGKSMTEVLTTLRTPSAAKAKPAAQEPPDDDLAAEPEPSKGKASAHGDPVLGKAAEVAKASPTEKMGKPVAKTAMPEPSFKTVPADKPGKLVAKTARPEPSEMAAPGKAPAADKAPKESAPAAWAKGVADGPGAGPLVGVSITSQPEGATVWINGKERGRTPLQVKVQSGAARVVMILAGHAWAAADVTASEGTKVSKQLTAITPPMEGEARFRAECTTQGKLPITIDGKETGVLCPFSKLRVDPGVHKIGLFVPALGVVHEKEVTLNPGVRSIVFAD